ncbi:aminotransferase class IV [Glaciihabitans sp. UYNi722]|uniref:aminotransferase class IV n=1 Tax=Glaciihabitans sp. UYNi722 TaxID=3156344 RepID=UPI0033943FAE
MSVTTICRWHDGELDPLEYCDMSDVVIAAADSWFVTDGTVLALDLHRSRFWGAIDDRRFDDLDAEAFWNAAIAAIPRSGDWFPRVELQLRQGAPLLVFRLRSAPWRSRSVRLASHRGDDPRTSPLVKGPDTDALLRVRTEAQALGADEAVILSPDGYVVEGAYSSLLWWRGAILCAPSLDLARLDSVTARSVIALATALGVEVYYESVTPAELDGVELWALSALHGIRIVTAWVDGPSTAEEPGRLASWRTRLDRLRKPLP